MTDAEWIIGDPATPEDGYNESPDTYLVHAVPPRFIMRYDPLEFTYDDELGALELPGEAINIRWLDPEPSADAMARLLATAMRVIGRCEEQDRERCPGD